MREIKFRAWDKIQKRFATLSINGVHVNIVNGVFALPTWAVGIEFNQYTGLKDKNETEIYEGDIVKGAGEMIDTPCIVKFGLGTFDCQVYSYMGFYLQLGEESQAEDTCWAENPSWLEVIGNIYENPDLLKPKQ